jgi:hypothetical protein
MAGLTKFSGRLFGANARRGAAEDYLPFAAFRNRADA